ncbi:MAG: hypothetical protein WCW27_01560 [Patescibacteria group bacterium]|jgi:hypothetical protein
MNFITSSDILSIIIILLVLFSSGFALFLPLWWWLKNYRAALQFVIPISLAIEILFGYVFYCFRIVHWFPLAYIGVVAVINIIIGIVLRHKIIQFWQQLSKLHWLTLLVGLGVIGVLVYTRFYDALTVVAPGAVDTYNHTIFLNDLNKLGYLHQIFYAPGFHLVLYPLLKILPTVILYRFVGPVLGLLIIASLYLFIRDIFKHTVTKYVTIILLILPVFNQLTLVTISFFSSCLTFIFFTAFIFLLAQPKQLSYWKTIILGVILTLALAIIVPYLYVQYVSAVGLCFLVAVVAKKYFGWKYVRFLLVFVLLGGLGLAASFGHVYLQNKINKNQTAGFPEIPVVVRQKNKTVTQNNKTKVPPATKTGKVVTSQEYPWWSVSKDAWQARYNKLSASDFWQKNIMPMLVTGQDLLQAKNVRSFSGMLAIGSYLWIILACVITGYATKKKNKLMVIIGVFSVLFGVATQTGILEMSIYRGRSGWYLMWLAVLGAAYLFDIIYHKRLNILIVIFGILACLAGVLYPPVFYRNYFADQFTVAAMIKQEYPNKQIIFISNQKELLILSPDFILAPFNIDSLEKQNGDFTNEIILILPKKFYNLDPVLSAQALSTDTGYVNFAIEQAMNEKNQTQLVAEIKAHPKFSHYKLYWESDDIAAYRLIQ